MIASSRYMLMKKEVGQQWMHGKPGAMERREQEQDLRTVVLEASDPGCGRKVAGKDVSRDWKSLFPQARSACTIVRDSSKGLSAWTLPATGLDPAARRPGGAVGSGCSLCLASTCSGWASGWLVTLSSRWLCGPILSQTPPRPFSLDSHF